MTPHGDIRQRLQDLTNLTGEITPQERGLAFERWLVDLLNASNLDAVGSYRPRGEQVDGSLVLDHRVVLFEAKWTTDRQAASSVYAFKGKVDGKLAGTLGAYISIAGYDEDTVAALERGKDLNIVLVDEEDLLAAIDVGMDRVLRMKLRAAAEQGALYFPVRIDVATAAETRGVNLATAGVGPRSLAVVVEGRYDRWVAAEFAHRVLSELPEGAGLSVDVLSSTGLRSMPRTAAALLGSHPSLAGVVLLADGDHERVEERHAELAGDERLRGQDVHVIIAQPTVATAWVGSEPPSGHYGSASSATPTSASRRSICRGLTTPR